MQFASCAAFIEQKISDSFGVSKKKINKLSKSIVTLPKMHKYSFVKFVFSCITLSVGLLAVNGTA